MPLDGEVENNDGPQADNVESEKKLDLFREQGLRVLRTIYSGAVEALPSSFSLRQRFFEIVEVTNLAQSDDLREEILIDMKRDFSDDPKYWNWLARLEMTDSVSKQETNEDIRLSQMQKAIQVYEEALKYVPSSMMFDQYTKFLMDMIAPKTEETIVSELSSHVKHHFSHLLAVYEKAEAMGCLSEDIACRYITLNLQLGKMDEARKLLAKLCSGELSDSVQLWLLRVSVEVKCVAKHSPCPSKADILSIFELLRSTLTKLSVSAAESLWFMALKFFINQKHYFDKLVEIVLISVAKDGGGEYEFSLPSAIINIVLQKFSKQERCISDFLLYPAQVMYYIKNTLNWKITLHLLVIKILL